MRLLPLFALGLLGCAQDHLTVLGEIQVRLDDAETGFAFDRRTNLVDDDLVDAGGPIAGHCRIGRDETGERVVSVALERPGSATEGSQLRRLQLQLRGDDPTQASIEAHLGEGTYTGTCDVTVPYLEAEDGLVGMDVAGCTLSGPSGDAMLSGTLDYEGCR